MSVFKRDMIIMGKEKTEMYIDDAEHVRYNVHIIQEGVLVMVNVNITNFRKELFEYINQVVEYNDIISVSTKNGNAIVMNEDDYNSLMETIQLMSIPGMREKLIDGASTPIEGCTPMEEVDW